MGFVAYQHPEKLINKIMKSKKFTLNHQTMNNGVKVKGQK
jgi:hypothetical protein